MIGLAAPVLAIALAATAAFSTSTAAAPAAVEGYVLRGYCGRVAVYMPGGAQPVETTAIELKSLPGADREMLEKGIYAADSAALARLLEDLGS
jgi:hypothetical protein